MRVLFIGNHNIGVRCLTWLLENGHEVAGVVGLPPDPNEQNYYESVLAIAERAGLPTFAPVDINEPSVVDALAALRPDLITVISYRQILRAPIINITPLGVINLHGAMLPKFRGASPINWHIIKGEKEGGVTIHYIDEGVDTGAILAQQPIPIEHDDTGVSLFDKVTGVGFDLFVEVVQQIASGTTDPQPNRKELGSYYRRRTPEHSKIDWTQSETEIYNLIRALVPPFPSAFTWFGDRKLTIEWGLPLAVQPLQAQPGEVFEFAPSGQIAIACGSGAILPETVHIDGLESGTAKQLFERAGIRPGTVLTPEKQPIGIPTRP